MLLLLLSLLRFTFFLFFFVVFLSFLARPSILTFHLKIASYLLYVSSYSLFPSPERSQR